MGAVVSARRKRWAPLLGSDELEFSDTAGRVGLRNLGNTCFMNAGLQCLSHLEPFTAYFLTGKYREEVNKTNPLGSRGEVAKAFAELQQALWQKRQPSHNPRELHGALKRFAPHLFEDYDQQDVQEFLAFCLDSLHEDLNLVTQKPKPNTSETEAADEKLLADKDQEYAAALAWMRYLERGKSFLVDLFQGQLRSSLTCADCGFVNRRFEAFLYLSVPVIRGTSMSQVSDAVEKYLEEEVLTDDERWLCPKCDRKVDARKKIDLWKLPPILVLHLKRFEFDMKTFQFKKIDLLLKGPNTMDMSPYVSSPQREKALYDVVAVANHHGAYGAGHYTAYCKICANVDDCEWHHFNDDKVSPLGSRDVISKDAYVIFLVRRAEEGQQLKRQTVTLPQLWPHWVSTRNSLLLDLVPGGNSPLAMSGNSSPAVNSTAYPEPKHEDKAEGTDSSTNAAKPPPVAKNGVQPPQPAAPAGKVQAPPPPLCSAKSKPKAKTNPRAQSKGRPVNR